MSAMAIHVTTLAAQGRTLVVLLAIFFALLTMLVLLVGRRYRRLALSRLHKRDRESADTPDAWSESARRVRNDDTDPA